MEPVTVVSGIAIPLRRSNVDTDQILPSDFGRRISRTGYEDALFAEWREDPEFILNQPAYHNPVVLVAGPDFGIGSSREHAVWALWDYGFRAVLSSRFSDIFRGNAGKCGLIAGQIRDADTERLWNELESQPGRMATVDLISRTVTCGTLVCQFQIDDYTRWQLMQGMDDIALTLRHEDRIAEYERRRRSWMPTTLPRRTSEGATMI